MTRICNTRVSWMTWLVYIVFLCIHRDTTTNAALVLPPKANLRGPRLFLDTADTAVWEELLPLGMFYGITTNPTLLERAGHQCTVKSVRALAEKALSGNNGHQTKADASQDSIYSFCQEFMCQAWGETAEMLYKVGMDLAEPNPARIVVKVPITEQGIRAASMLVQSGTRVCFTAAYNHQQAIVAAGVFGVEYLAPYLGRMTRLGGLDGMEECHKMQRIVDGLESKVRILVASIQSADEIAKLSAQGMDTFTFSPDVARQLLRNELTLTAANDFEEAAIRCGGAEDLLSS